MTPVVGSSTEDELLIMINVMASFKTEPMRDPKYPYGYPTILLLPSLIPGSPTLGLFSLSGTYISLTYNYILLA